MPEFAIQVHELGKRYRIGEVQQYKALRDTLTDWLLAPARAAESLRSGRRANRRDNSTIWALRNVSFGIKQGEAVGVIGSNGAGKSTLLKLLSRITEPTEGSAEIHGRVGSLLEVGTGFHPELTGRENVYLNGAILGMHRREIDQRFDEIVAFAEVERFIDTPVKHYSSGMYLRLAFAVAAHLEPEILLVDEVLAVGDAAFQQKCLGKMNDITKQGRTVLFVSHNMGAIVDLCSRCILLDSGGVVADGIPGQVVPAYLTRWRERLRSHYRAGAEKAADDDRATLLEAEILDSTGASCDQIRFGEPFSIRMVWQHHAAIPSACYAIRVHDTLNRFLFGVNTMNSELRLDEAGTYEIVCRFDDNVLVPGEFFISAGCYVRPHSTVHVVEPCLTLTVADVPYCADAAFNIVGNPMFAPRPVWELR